MTRVPCIAVIRTFVPFVRVSPFSVRAPHVSPSTATLPRRSVSSGEMVIGDGAGHADQAIGADPGGSTLSSMNRRAHR